MSESLILRGWFPSAILFKSWSHLPCHLRMPVRGHIWVLRVQSPRLLVPRYFEKHIKHGFGWFECLFIICMFIHLYIYIYIHEHSNQIHIHVLYEWRNNSTLFAKFVFSTTAVSHSKKTTCVCQIPKVAILVGWLKHVVFFLFYSNLFGGFNHLEKYESQWV